MVKHTPGPWELMHAEHGAHVEVVTNKGHVGVVFAGRFADASTGEANARLIAAAPELLEALRLAATAIDCATAELGASDVPINHREMWAMLCNSFDLANAAIAKAEGK